MGALTLTECQGALVRVTWEASGHHDVTPFLEESKAQFGAYFDRRLRRFDLPWRVDGSDAQMRACTAMAAFPCGETRTYGTLAKELGLSAQAMGQLCGANPLPILVPCHRVLSATGLGGFSGGRGIEDKIWLLRHEKAAALLI